MTSITSSFGGPFPVSGDLGLGVSSLLGGNAQASSNAAGIAPASTLSGPLGAIANSLNTSVSPTVDALRTGKLTTKQHTVLAALYGAGQPTNIPWNANGTEPSVVSQERAYGWIKLVKPSYDQTTRAVTGGTYELTPVGKAIARRTGGGGVTSTGISVTA
jgi:hypothetical protein